MPACSRRSTRWRAGDALGGGARSAAMSDRPHDGWASDRRRWRIERLDPALARLPERRPSFVTLGDLPVEPLYGPWDLSDSEDGSGEPTGPGGPTLVDHHGDPLRHGAGRYADADLGRDV